MTRLADLDTMLLSTASQRDGNSLLPPPGTARATGARLQKAIARLLDRGLAEERSTSDAAAMYRMRPTGAASPSSRRMPNSCGIAIGVGRLGSIAGPLLAGVARGAGMSVNDVLLSLLPIAILVGLGASVAFRRDVLLPKAFSNVS